LEREEMTLEQVRRNGRLQLVLGLLSGIVFGFLLQKGGVTSYDVIIGQLLLTDFTVIRVMLSAVLVGMLGVYSMKGIGIAGLHCRPGSVGATVAGGLVFGIGFALLGYCPGTAAGAVGTGAVDALFGVAGIIIGAGIFARAYPYLDRVVLNRGKFPAETVPELLGIRPAVIVAIVAMLILVILWLLAVPGL
jgi:hypothetical protein